MAVYRQPGGDLLSLIPYWNSAVIDQVNLSDIALTGHDGILGDGMAGHLHHGVLL